MLLLLTTRRPPASTTGQTPGSARSLYPARCPRPPSRCMVDRAGHRPQRGGVGLLPQLHELMAILGAGVRQHGHAQLVQQLEEVRLSRLKLLQLAQHLLGLVLLGQPVVDQPVVAAGQRPPAAGCTTSSSAVSCTASIRRSRWNASSCASPWVAFTSSKRSPISSSTTSTSSAVHLVCVSRRAPSRVGASGYHRGTGGNRRHLPVSAVLHPRRQLQRTAPAGPAEPARTTGCTARRRVRGRVVDAGTPTRGSPPPSARASCRRSS